MPVRTSGQADPVGMRLPARLDVGGMGHALAYSLVGVQPLGQGFREISFADASLKPLVVAEIAHRVSRGHYAVLVLQAVEELFDGHVPEGQPRTGPETALDDPLPVLVKLLLVVEPYEDVRAVRGGDLHAGDHHDILPAGHLHGVGDEVVVGDRQSEMSLLGETYGVLDLGERIRRIRVEMHVGADESVLLETEHIGLLEDRPVEVIRLRHSSRHASSDASMISSASMVTHLRSS